VGLHSTGSDKTEVGKSNQDKSACVHIPSQCFVYLTARHIAAIMALCCPYRTAQGDKVRHVDGIFFMRVKLLFRIA